MLTNMKNVAAVIFNILAISTLVFLYWKIEKFSVGTRRKYIIAGLIMQIIAMIFYFLHVFGF